MAIKCLLQLFFSRKYYFFNYILQLRSMTSFSTVVDGSRVNFDGNSGNRSGLFCDRQMSRDPNIGTTKDKVQKLWKQAETFPATIQMSFSFGFSSYQNFFFTSCFLTSKSIKLSFFLKYRWRFCFLLIFLGNEKLFS